MNQLTDIAKRLDAILATKMQSRRSFGALLLSVCGTIVLGAKAKADELFSKRVPMHLPTEILPGDEPSRITFNTTPLGGMIREVMRITHDGQVLILDQATGEMRQVVEFRETEIKDIVRECIFVARPTALVECPGGTASTGPSVSYCGHCGGYHLWRLLSHQGHRVSPL